MSLTRLESETGINYNDEEDFAIVYSANKWLNIKLDKLCKLYPKDFKTQNFAGDDDEIKSYHIPKKYVSIRTPRILSEKQKVNLEKLHTKQKVSRSKKERVAVSKTG